jgi:glycosyltransferase involved in cell wall biosynthesis
MRALFVYENDMGHRTHGRLLEKYVRADSRFDPMFLPLDRDFSPKYPAKLVRAPIPLLHHYGADFWALRQVQYRSLRMQMEIGRVTRNQFDLVYVHTHSSAARARRLFPNARLVVSIDGTWKAMNQDAGFASTRWFDHLYRTERRIFQQSDLIVSFSEWAATSAVSMYDIDPGKVHIARNGIPFFSGTEILRGKVDGLLHIGFVGNQFFRKGGDLLLRLHQSKFADDTRLTIVSNETFPERSLKNVTVRRNVPWEKLNTEVIPNFDLFVLPTSQDCSPYAVIEAMSAGVPVISTRVGAIPEMIRDGIDGFLANPNDESEIARRISWALRHREDLKRMGSNARLHVAENYTAEKEYSSLLELLLSPAE